MHWSGELRIQKYFSPRHIQAPHHNTAQKQQLKNTSHCLPGCFFFLFCCFFWFVANNWCRYQVILLIAFLVHKNFPGTIFHFHDKSGIYGSFSLIIYACNTLPRDYYGCYFIPFLLFCVVSLQSFEVRYTVQHSSPFKDPVPGCEGI